MMSWHTQPGKRTGKQRDTNTEDQTILHKDNELHNEENEEGEGAEQKQHRARRVNKKRKHHRAEEDQEEDGDED